MLRVLSGGRWDFRAAAHLLNRAGFGGAPHQIQELAEKGLDGAVSWLVDFEKVDDSTPDPEWAKPDPERAEELRQARQAGEEERRKLLRGYQQNQRQHLMQLRAWWLQRMATG